MLPVVAIRSITKPNTQNRPVYPAEATVAAATPELHTTLLSEL